MLIDLIINILWITLPSFFTLRLSSRPHLSPRPVFLHSPSFLSFPSFSTLPSFLTSRSFFTPRLSSRSHLSSRPHLSSRSRLSSRPVFLHAPVFLHNSNLYPSLQRGFEIGDEVVDVLDTDTQTQHVRVYPCSYLFLRTELRMGCRCGMHYQRLGIAHAAYMQD